MASDDEPVRDGTMATLPAPTSGAASTEPLAGDASAEQLPEDSIPGSAKRSGIQRRQGRGGEPPWQRVLARGQADGRLTFRHREAPRRGSTRPLADAELHPDLQAALLRSGIERLYTHQQQALDAAWRGPVIITTATASGKSLCFNLPALDVLCRDRRARALYLYPTKALAQDQLRTLQSLGLSERLRPAIYDGDTPRPARAAIRKSANLLLSNPDMLHRALLPNHQLWADFFANLAFVVVDEVHVYRGVFGSHVANVLRRLRRIADAYGTEPRFLLTSATIANAEELAERLTGLTGFQAIGRSGAPAPGREIAIWNPSAAGADDAPSNNAHSEAIDLLCALLGAGARTICFAHSRAGVELLTRAVTERLAADGQHALADAIAAYRSGYTAADRRSLEQDLLGGRLRAIVATNALELGVDLGAFDAAIVVGFPGTLASLRQMWGRAGRKQRGLAIFIAGEDALDRYFCRHPRELLERPPEAAILDHRSPQVLAGHLRCAAQELPLTRADDRFFGKRWRGGADLLVSEGVLAKRSWRAAGAGGPPGGGAASAAPGGISTGALSERYVPRSARSLASEQLSLRSGADSELAIFDAVSGELLGSTDGSRATLTLHAGAVYLHQGAAYEVLALDQDRGHVSVAPFAGDWHTRTRRQTQTLIEAQWQRQELLGLQVCFGELNVSEQVLGFERVRMRDRARLDYTALAGEPVGFRTQGMWICFGAEQLGALHAIEHALLAILPLLAMCDGRDIGGLSIDAHAQLPGAAIFIFDAHPGGVGISHCAFERLAELCERALGLLEACACSDGCPSCIQSARCGSLNEPLAKDGAAALLRRMLASA